MKGPINLRALTVLLAGTTAFAVACGKEPKREGADTAKGETAGAATGKVIIVEAYSDEKGNYFKPNEIAAHRGDIVRFTLKAGVHNVHFLQTPIRGRRACPRRATCSSSPIRRTTSRSPSRRDGTSSSVIRTSRSA